ncbi:MAG: histidine kinase [Lachnospiraceae bacterium]|nr:histidine kinase [Lachnospiraceae bacterium]
MSRLVFFYKDRPLFQQFIIAFIAVILCPILFMMMFSYYNGANEIKKRYEESFWKAAEAVNSDIREKIEELNELTLQMVSQKEIKYFALQRSDNYYEKYVIKQWGERQLFLRRFLSQNNYIGRVSIVGDTGIEYSFYGDEGQEYDGDLYDHASIVEKADKYREILPADGRSAVFLSHLKEGAHVNYLTVARRFSADSYFQMGGTIFVEIQAAMLPHIMSSVAAGEVWVADGDGYLVYQPDTGKIGSHISEYMEMELFDEERGSFTVKLGGKPFFMAYVKDFPSGWISIFTIPVDQMEKPIQYLKTLLLYTLVIALPLTLLLGYYFSKSILEPIHQLEWYMKRLGQEKWEKVIGSIPGNEIGTLMLQYNEMVEQMQELVEKVYKAELQQSQDKLAKRNAQLQALQTQINPHFLYNTLGAINTYAMEADQREIEQMVNMLGKMLRYAVQNPLEPVKIADEVDHLQSYLTIMKYRYWLMPEIIWDVDSCMEQPILRLTIQPLVENVFQHAFGNGIREGHYICIRTHKGDQVLVEVEDNGIGIDGLAQGKYYRLDEVPGVTFGIGLNNVNKRIQLIYGEAYGIILYRNGTGGTTIRLVLPNI